jgi:hypothetical protein
MERTLLLSLLLSLCFLHAALGANAQPGTPSFWKSRLADVLDVLGNVSKGQVMSVGESWGRRPLLAVSYGKADNYKRSANFGAAAYARHPEAFCKRDPGAKPVLMILGPVHGGEMEGVAGCLNLVKVLETGTDFRGKAWPGITNNAARLRVVILPLSNPDGRERLPFDSYMGKTAEYMHQYSQGTHKDGSDWGWPTMAERHPMVGDVGFLGACFNDGGVNVYNDCFFSPMAPETRAIFDLAIKEAPDFIVNVHSHEMPAELLRTYMVPPALVEWTSKVQAMYAERMKQRGLPFTPPRETMSGAFELVDALYHATGAVSMVFEGPEGIVGEAEKPIDFDTILDSHLALYEMLFELGVSEGGFMGKKDAVRGDWLPPMDY